MSTRGRALDTAWVMTGLAATGAILVAAETFLAPVLLALVAGVIVTPLNDVWERVGLPRVMSALLSLALALAVIGMLVLALQPVVTRMIDEAPKIAGDIQSSLRDMRSALRDLDEVQKDVAKAVQGDATTVEKAVEGKAAAAEIPSVTDALMLAPAILAQIILFAGTLFFFIATRDEIYGWLLRVLPDRGGTPMDASHLRAAERKVSRYFFTITLINAGLAVATGAMLQMLGLPGAIEWGLLIFFANFIVYLGPALFGAALVFAGIAAFDGAYALLPALCFFALNLVEGQFVTPSLVGREMRINPLIVFLAVTFGLWLWGAIGGIIMIPILVWASVLFGPQPQALTMASPDEDETDDGVTPASA